MTPGRVVSHLEFAAQADATPWARRHTRDFLHRWGLGGELIDNVELAVSELVTNAIHQAERNRLACRITRIALTPRSIVADVAVEVLDPDPQLPQPAEPTPTDAEHGRGLFLVASMAKAWGAFHSPSGGKCVWCLIDRIPCRSESALGPSFRGLRRATRDSGDDTGKEVMISPTPHPAVAGTEQRTRAEVVPYLARVEL